MKLAVFRQAALHPSETFVRDQIRAFSSGNARLFAVDHVEGLPLDFPHWVLSDQGQRQRVLGSPAFKVSRHSRSLLEEMSEWGAQAILAHFTADAWRVQPLAQKLDVPLFVICHGSDVLMKPSQALRDSLAMAQVTLNWRRLVARTAMFLPVSNFLADALIARGVGRDKVQRHYTGVQLPAPSGSTTKDGRYQAHGRIVAVGRLVDNKGFDDLIEALGLLALSDVRVTLDLVGSGPAEPLLRAKVADVGLTDRVSFHGRLPHADVLQMISAADVLCAPSRRSASGVSEGLSQVTLEAQSLGVPVVGYRTGGLPEAVVDSVTGCLVEPGDVGALASSLRSVLQDESLRRRLGEAGRQRTIEQFDVRSQTARLEGRLHQLVRLYRRGELGV